MTRKFAVIIGLIYLIAGGLGFVPGLVSPHAGDPSLSVEISHGRMLGLFPVNAVHNVVHIVIGLWGLTASKEWGSAVIFSRGLAILYGVLAVLGLIPATYTLFGLAPIHGMDVLLHAGTAAIAAYFGWIAGGIAVKRT